jgi:hypothetical protein
MLPGWIETRMTVMATSVLPGLAAFLAAPACDRISGGAIPADGGDATRA